MRLGVKTAGGAKWLHTAASVTARYVPGVMRYTVRDPLLGVVVPDEVGDGGVAACDTAGDLLSLCEIQSRAAELDGLAHLQQVVPAEQVDLGGGRGVRAVTFSCGHAQFRGQHHRGHPGADRRARKLRVHGDA